MDLALLLTIALIAAGGSVALAVGHARRVRAATSGDAESLANALKRVDKSSRLAELERRGPPGSWERRLAEDALAATDDTVRVATVNEALAEVEHALVERASWPSAGVRIAALSALFVAAAAYRLTGQPRWSLVIIAIGAASALACFEIGRGAKRRAEAQRKAIDALIAVVLGDLVEASSAPRAGRPAATERRSNRRRAARAGAS